MRLFTSVAAWILLVGSSLSKTACYRLKKKKNFIPDEYEYPVSNLRTGKTFIYKNLSDTSISMLHDSKIINEQGSSYLIERSYNQTSTLDSEKYTVDKELIEFYLFGPPPAGKLKGSIIQDEIVDDGTRLGKGLFKVKFKGYDFTITITTENYFLKDTIINWNDQNLECLKTKRKELFEFDNKRHPSASSSSKSFGEGYFAKGIGLIRYHRVTEKGSATMGLSEIKDLNAP